MGTNFYYHSKPDCEYCGRSFEPIHIGKSSAGWVFALHVYPEDSTEAINDLPDWLKLFDKEGSFIRDEYGQTVSVPDMIRYITERGREDWSKARKKIPFMYKSWRDFHEQNNSEEGPQGLLRSKTNSRCIAHGAGTWDLFVGEFS